MNNNEGFTLGNKDFTIDMKVKFPKKKKPSTTKWIKINIDRPNLEKRMVLHTTKGKWHLVREYRNDELWRETKTLNKYLRG